MVKTKLYFASDFHLGIPSKSKSLEREKKIIAWLNNIKSDAKSIYLLGDIFDFWFEYKTVVPKGHVRLLSKLASLVDDGINVNIITGNHDMWMGDYLPNEIGIKILDNKTIISENGKDIFLTHGDGLVPGDLGYKLIKKIFKNKLCQWLFARLHPNFSIGIAQFWSKKSRIANEEKADPFSNKEKEGIVSYCKRKKSEIDIDYFIFGHRHLPLEINIDEKTKYINLGDWIHHNSYAVFDKGKLELKYFK